MAVSGCLALGGLLLLAWETATQAGPSSSRLWNLLRWLGLGLPAPDNPWLIGPTLAFLNARLWFAATLLGLVLAAALLVVRALDRR